MLVGAVARSADDDVRDRRRRLGDRLEERINVALDPAFAAVRRSPAAGEARGVHRLCPPGPDAPRAPGRADRYLGLQGLRAIRPASIIGWLTPMAHKPRGPEQLVSMLIDELRRRRILLPSTAVLEMIVHQARPRREHTPSRPGRWSRYRHARVARSTSGADAREYDQPFNRRPPATFSAWPSACVSCARLASIGSDGATFLPRPSSGSPPRDCA